MKQPLQATKILHNTLLAGPPVSFCSLQEHIWDHQMRSPDTHIKQLEKSWSLRAGKHLKIYFTLLQIDFCQIKFSY